eukprot:TRINITY_DN63416_c0_g1_i1.p1 TRINITY_DN63416_c0_g1~~TRINITY_DN63416_c0_g1_i1.p1  ORF type:complete len:367 (+),score=25.19 TRINITY_DN63416_c0_g1_i1:53-1153(+)
MQATILASILALCLFYVPAGAFPSFLRICRPWRAGERRNIMSQTILSDGQDNAACMFALDSMPTSVVPGQQYNVTLVASKPSLFKLYSSDGQCIGDDDFTVDPATSKTFAWTAPGGGPSQSVALHALCCADYDAEVYAVLPHELCVGDTCSPDSNSEGKPVITNDARKIEAVLLIHIVLMSVAWVCMLPLGAAVARYTRHIDGLPEGSWFPLHRRLQGTGCILQLLGALAAIYYVQYSSIHFRSLHARIGIGIVIIGMLQPLIAVLRPRKHDGWARTVFETVHKGSGWLSVIFALVNACLGVMLLQSKGFGSGAVGGVSALVMTCAIPVAILLYSAQSHDNGCVRWFFGAGAVEDDASDTLSSSAE